MYQPDKLPIKDCDEDRKVSAFTLGMMLSEKNALEAKGNCDEQGGPGAED